MNLDLIFQKLPHLPIDKQEEVLRLLDQYKGARDRERCQNGFLHYVKKMWPGFIAGRHHKLMADKFERIA